MAEAFTSLYRDHCITCILSRRKTFEDISKLLGDIGVSEKIREVALTGMDQLFAIRWTCLSLEAIRPILGGEWDVEIQEERIKRMVQLEGTIEPAVREGDYSDSYAMALAGYQKIDEILQKAKDCLFMLYDALPETEELTEEVKEILGRYESQIADLENINIEADCLGVADWAVLLLQDVITRVSHRITSQIPGVLDHLDQTPISFSRLVELSRDTRKRQIIQPMQTLKAMCSPATTLRNILNGQGDADAYKELRRNLTEFRYRTSWQGDEMQRQWWRTIDLSDGCGLGFTVELFFLALSQLLSTSSSNESHSALYTGTFRAITSDWSKHKDSLGTQNLLLGIAMSRREEFDEDYPAYIVNKFLELLGNILEGQTGPYIDKAKQQFEDFLRDGSTRFKERVLRILSGGQTQVLAS